jgi:NADPH2:quinone reductase
VKAVVVERLTGAEGLAVIDRPAPKADEGAASVLVAVHAAGVSFPDLLLSQGKYQQSPEVPFVPGVEAAGIVVEAPAGVGLRRGQRVVVSSFGSWAEQVAVPPSEVFPLPDSLSMAQGTALLMNYQTAHFGLLRRGRLQPAETLLVHGAAGGVGSAAIQVGKAVGARVIAAVSDRRKAEVANQAGADACVLADQGWLDRVKDLTAGAGVDVIFDPVGGDRFDDSVRALALEGRLVVIGFTGGSIPRLAMNRVLFRNVDIVGAAWGAFLEREPQLKQHIHSELVRMVEAGFVAPLVGAEFPLERAGDALKMLEERRAVGKVVLTLRREEAA